MDSTLVDYLRRRANLDGYDMVRVGSARSRKSENIHIMVWIRAGSSVFLRTFEISQPQYYNHSEEWGELYEEIRLNLLFG